ncbi:hypothetical protein GGI11_008164, partial [Coemansia sp. RSA 2049]
DCHQGWRMVCLLCLARLHLQHLCGCVQDRVFVAGQHARRWRQISPQVKASATAGAAGPRRRECL